MRSKLIFFVLCFLMFHIVAKSQNQVYKEATISHPAELWNSFKVANGTNVLDGVSLYTHDGKCSSTAVKLVKIVNLNNYPVSFSYQLTANHTIVNVLVPASFSIEGSCDSSDENISKLVITVPVAKNEAEEKLMREFLLSHLFVSKL